MTDKLPWPISEATPAEQSYYRSLLNEHPKTRKRLIDRLVKRILERLPTDYTQAKKLPPGNASGLTAPITARPSKKR